MNSESKRGWPAGKTLAVFVNVMLEGWSDDAPPQSSPSNPVRRGYIDTRGHSWAAYGPKAGAPRLLKVLAARGVRATFFTSGAIAERYPELVAGIAKAGHSVQCHGYYQNLPPLYLDEAQERDTIARCKDVLKKTTGRPPEGWLSPRAMPSTRTPSLLARAGFRWHADACDADLPYVQKTENGPIVAVPYGNDVNDWRLHIGTGNPVQAYSDTLARALTRWYGRHSEPACLDVTVHAHIFGRPVGAAEFEMALEVVQATPFAWTVTQDELLSLAIRKE